MKMECTRELVVSVRKNSDRFDKKCVCEDCRHTRNLEMKYKYYNPAEAQAKREAKAIAEGRVYVKRKVFK